MMMMNKRPFLFALPALTLFFGLSSAFLLRTSNPGGRLLFAFVTALLTIGLVATVHKSSHKTALAVGILFLVVMLIPATTAVPPLPNNAIQPFNGWAVIALLFIPCVSLIVVALLIASAVSLQQQQRPFAAPLLLSILLLAKAMHNIYWHFVWDTTYDALDIFWLPITFLPIGVGGLVLLITLPKRKALISGAYTLLPLLVIGTAVLAWQVDFRELTETRAERVSRAVVAFQQREGRYPASLRELTPRTMLTVSEPVILFGQDWCYDGGSDYFRLGYVDREHWSSPYLTGHLYAAAGDTTDLTRLCAAEINTFLSAHPNFYVWDNE